MKIILTTFAAFLLLISTHDIAFSAWEDISPDGTENVIYFGIDFYNDNLGMAVGQDMATKEGIMSMTTDGGASWQVLSVGGNTHLRGVGFVGDSNIVVGGYDGPPGTVTKIIVSTNGGVDWSITETATVKGINEVEAAGDSVVYTIGYGTTPGFSAGIMKSTNGGVDWSIISTGGGIYMKCMDFVDEDTGFIGATNFQIGYFFRTTDGGANWVQSNFVKSITGMHFFDAQNGIIISDKVYRTSDAGDNWNEIASIDSDISRLEFYDENVGFAAGKSGKVIRTNDGGNSWEAEEINTDKNIEYISITGDYVYLSGRGGMVFRQKIEAVEQKEPVISSSLELDKINFSTVVLNETASFDFVITNDGTSDLTIERFDEIDPDNAFALKTDVSLPYVINPDSSLELSASFSPAVTGKTYAGTLTIISNAKNKPSFDILVTGIGGEPSAVELGNADNGNYISISCNPNPVISRSVVRIDLKSENVQHIKLYLIDNTGRIISEIAMGTISPGISSYNFDSALYPAGMYFLVSEIFGKSVILPVIIEK